MREQEIIRAFMSNHEQSRDNRRLIDYID